LILVLEQKTSSNSNAVHRRQQEGFAVALFPLRKQFGIPRRRMGGVSHFSGDNKARKLRNSIGAYSLKDK
jgi:hypothetical protein